MVWYFIEFVQVDEDVVISSGSGGITLSVVTWILMIMLSLNEFALYWAKRNVPTEHLTVDTSVDQQVIGGSCEGLNQIPGSSGFSLFIYSVIPLSHSTLPLVLSENSCKLR